MVCLSRPYPFKFFRGCFTQILHGQFLNTLSQLVIISNHIFLDQASLAMEYALTFIVKLYGTGEGSFDATLHRLEAFSVTPTGFCKKRISF